jgi:hypothetical protein
MLTLVRHAARRSDLSPLRPGETLRIAEGHVLCMRARRRWRADVTVWLLAGLVITGMFGAGVMISSRFYLVGGCVSRVSATQIQLEQYAYEVYPSWSAAHPERLCPQSLAELTVDLGSDSNRDAWGQPLDLRCGAELPAGAKGLWLRSAGPDGVFGTDDDLTSDSRSAVRGDEGVVGG